MIIPFETVNEAINPSKLQWFANQYHLNMNDGKKLYQAVLDVLGYDDKPLSKNELKAYGSSEAELKEACEVFVNLLNARKVGYSRDDINAHAKGTTDAVANFARFTKEHNKDGKLDDSKALDLIKRAVDRLSDEEFGQVLSDGELTPEECEDLGCFSKECLDLFNIPKDERKNYLSRNKGAIQSMVKSMGGKRKLKRGVKNATDKVKGFFKGIF